MVLVIIFPQKYCYTVIIGSRSDAGQTLGFLDKNDEAVTFTYTDIEINK